MSQSHIGNPSPTTGSGFPATLGELRTTGYRYRSVKQELRDNTLQALARGEQVFPGVLGYQDSVLPELFQAILS